MTEMPPEARRCLAAITNARRQLLELFAQHWTEERARDVYAKQASGDWQLRSTYKGPGEPFSYSIALVHRESGTVDTLVRCDGIRIDDSYD